jgi:opacity protein-like surface antigen
MRRATVVAAVVGVCVLAVDAEAGSLDLRGGAFFPRAESNLFFDDAELYLRDGRPIERSDWNNAIGGFQWNQEIAPLLEIGFSVDFFQRTLQTSYRDYVSSSGREILQTLQLNMAPMAVQLRLGPTRRGQISPYVAVGGDLVYYEYEEYGDFVDFDDPSHPIVPDAFISQGVTPGFHVAGGVRFPVSDDFSINAEGRYQWAEDDMGDDFRGNRIDLSGASVTVGLNIRF